MILIKLCVGRLVYINEWDTLWYLWSVGLLCLVILIVKLILTFQITCSAILQLFVKLFLSLLEFTRCCKFFLGWTWSLILVHFELGLTPVYIHVCVWSWMHSNIVLRLHSSLVHSSIILVFILKLRWILALNSLEITVHLLIAWVLAVTLVHWLC